MSLGENAMSLKVRTVFVFATIVLVAVMLGVSVEEPGAQAQSYRQVEGWAKLPAGVEWGQVISVDPDPTGRFIYVFHRSEPPILKFDMAGNVVESFGDGMFAWPHGFTVDDDGFIWASDGGRGTFSADIISRDGLGHQVFKFSPEGKVLMRLGTAGVAGDGPDTFNGPTDIAIADNGDIFVSDGHGNNRMVKFSKDGTFIKAWGTGGPRRGEFNLPHSIAIDSQGRLFVGDRMNGRIQIFDQDGHFLEEWTQFGMVSGLFIADDDTIYVTDYQQEEAILIGSAKDGSIHTRIEDRNGEGIAIDAMGNIYHGEVAGRVLTKYAKQ